ncbi:MAG TPA: DUF2073 domain-containing protein [archaeon]|nr:DUF2073 domain-containing protein [archaeon]
MKVKVLKMDFVSSSTLDQKRDNRISFILNKVRDGSILVTDAVLHPQEEMDLIKETMRRVDDGFPGIEVCSLKKQVKGLQLLSENFTDQKERLQKMFGMNPKASLKNGITLIGPAKLIKKIKKNPNSFSVLAGV